jgi:predicted DNA-binding transcriptional regulator AlpA
MSRPPTPAYVSRETGAALLDISVDTWDAMVKAGRLPKAVEIGEGLERWRWTEVEHWLQTVEPVSENLIYFVGFGSYVKIGYTTNPIEFRLAGIQTGTPEKLTVFATVKGTPGEEKALHRRFAIYRTNGEWFRNEGELADYIRSLGNADNT